MQGEPRGEQREEQREEEQRKETRAEAGEEKREKQGEKKNWGDRRQLQYEYLLHSYRDLTVLAGEEPYQTILCQDILDGGIATKKFVPLSQQPVYEKLAGVSHPGLVPVRAVAAGEGQAVVIQDYVSGETLADRMRRGYVFTERETVRTVLSLLSALEVLHQRGIVHRDLHPGNILISTDQVVKILDLGIARAIKEGKNRDTQVLGTVGFAAPEQFGFAQTDGRTDIYSVGVLMCLMLTGREPGQAVLPKKWEEVICRCTAISPQERYAGAGELRKEILCRAGMSAGQGDRGRIPGFRTGKKWKKAIAVIGYTLMILATLLFLYDAAVKGGAIGIWAEAIAMILAIWLPFLICSNWGDWDRRIRPFCRWDKDVMIAFRIAAPLLLVYGGLWLDGLIRADVP